MQDSLQVLRDSLEIELLRSQVELMDAHYSELQETIYWAVGGVLALATLIAGVNIFLGVRAFARERAAIQSELEGVVAERLSEAESSLQASSRASSERLEGLIENKTQNLQKSIGAKIKSATDNLSDKIDFQVKSVRSELHAVTLEQTLSEADALIKKSSKDYGLWMLGKALELTSTAQYGYTKLSSIIDRINSVLDETDGSQIESNTTTKLIKALDNVDGDYSHDAEIVKERIRQIRSTSPPNA